MPPFLGQGMCAGIRDAANLEWKLARVLRGASDASILDTYETERAPHVRSIIESAVTAGRIIQTTDPEEAAARDAFLLDRTVERPPTPGLPPIGPGLGDPGDALRAERVPQPLDADGTRRDDLLGDEPALVVDPSVWRDLDPTTRAEIGDAITVVDTPLLEAWLDAHAVVAAVARPDRHVLGGTSDPAAIADLVHAALRGLHATRG
jgi:3-(3-hydroxy-phenyl)propionate hydroxylase